MCIRDSGRLLDRVRGIEARIGEPDDLGARALRLEQERREVLRAQGVAHRTPWPARSGGVWNMGNILRGSTRWQRIGYRL